LTFKSAFLALINSKIEKKKAQPLIAQNLNGFDRVKFSDKGNDLDKKIITYNKTIVKVNEKIQNLKNTANKEQNKLEVEHKIAYLNLVEIRFSETLITLVTEYEAVKKLLDSKEKEREQKEKELADHNEQISNKCLAEVNRILKECGCRYVIKLPDNFSKKGYSPVLEIWFTLFGKDVPINKFGEVLSDSDKRVLALAFFIAQLNTDREKLKETIIILDDPFTSFDDDRIEQVFTIIKEIATNAKQIIILSHYGKPLAHLSSELNGHLQLKIKNSDKGSTLEQTDLIKLLSNQHENRLDKLDNAVSDSIEEKDVVSLKSDLRIVIEDEIKTRFRQQLKGTNITTLGSLIDKIEELNKDNKISFKENGEKVITALREINERTSREHHSNPNYQNNQISTPEGIKTTIKNAFDLIYTKL
jgi:wobble nucleotide-excising tRNase